MSKINGMLNTYENSSMSLSCEGTMTIENGILTGVTFKGYPRPIIDGWTAVYKYHETGDQISKDTIDTLLSFNGKNNIISIFKEIK